MNQFRRVKSRLSRRPRNARRRTQGSSQLSRNAGTHAGPPAFSTSVAFSHKFRWYCDAIRTGGVISYNFMGGYLSLAVAANELRTPIQALRLRRIALYGPPPASVGATPSSIMFQWAGDAGISGTSKTYIDTATNSSDTPTAVIVPPSFTDQSNWHLTSDTSYAFLIWAPAGTIMDITLDIVLIDDATISPVVNSGSGYTVGGVYWGRGDGYQGHWLPVTPGSAAQ